MGSDWRSRRGDGALGSTGVEVGKNSKEFMEFGLNAGRIAFLVVRLRSLAAYIASLSNLK
jgi:hypothetical protein